MECLRKKRDYPVHASCSGRTILQVIGPGLLSGTSRERSAGGTPYAIADAKAGYEDLWRAQTP